MVIIIKDEKDHSYMKKRITDGNEKIIFLPWDIWNKIKCNLSKIWPANFIGAPNTLFLIRNRRSVEPAKFLKNRTIPQLKISCFGVLILGVSLVSPSPAPLISCLLRSGFLLQRVSYEKKSVVFSFGNVTWQLDMFYSSCQLWVC